jgi:hypothetical protein
MRASKGRWIDQPLFDQQGLKRLHPEREIRRDSLMIVSVIRVLGVSVVRRLL